MHKAIRLSAELAEIRNAVGKGEKHRTLQMLEEGRDASPSWRHSGDAKEPENTGAGNR